MCGMCGYCVEENHALKILEKDVQGNIHTNDLKQEFMRYFYLRESPDFISASDKVRRSLAQKGIPIASDIPQSVMLARGLEILLEQGFESPAYQLLLKKQHFRDAIAATCSNEERGKFESATAGLGIEFLGMLYDAETYFWGERSRQLRTLATVLPSCRNLLKHYIAWWLKGQNLQKADLSEHMKDCVTEDERSRCYLLSRAIYFSILMVGSCSAGKKMLQAIAENLPVDIPAAYGDDLWFQRIAALKLYELEGLKAFSTRVASIRATSYIYIDLIRGFSWKQKQFLLDEVKRQAEAGKADDFNHITKWLEYGFA